MKTILSKLTFVVLSFLVAFPATAKMGKAKAAKGTTHGAKEGLLYNSRGHNSHSAPPKYTQQNFWIELSKKNFPMGNLLYENNSFDDIWKELSEQRRSELIEKWNKQAQASYDATLHNYATHLGEESYCSGLFTTYTNSYDKFILDVASISKGEDDSLIGMSHINADFRDMIDSGASIMAEIMKQAHKNNARHDRIVAWRVSVIFWAIFLASPWGGKKIKEFVAKKRLAKLTGKIDDYSIRNGFKKSAIERLGKEVYVRFQTNEKCDLTIAQGAKPNKEGFYLCAWALKDPKDEHFYYICAPSDYQILFNPDTGKVEMQELKDRDSQ